MGPSLDAKKDFKFTKITRGREFKQLWTIHRWRWSKGIKQKTRDFQVERTDENVFNWGQPSLGEIDFSSQA